MMLLRRFFSYLLVDIGQPVILNAVVKRPWDASGAGRVWSHLLEDGVVRVHHLGLDHGVHCSKYFNHIIFTSSGLFMCPLFWWVWNVIIKMILVEIGWFKGSKIRNLTGFPFIYFLFTLLFGNTRFQVVVGGQMSSVYLTKVVRNNVCMLLADFGRLIEVQQRVSKANFVTGVYVWTRLQILVWSMLPPRHTVFSKHWHWNFLIEIIKFHDWNDWNYWKQRV